MLFFSRKRKSFAFRCIDRKENIYMLKKEHTSHTTPRSRVKRVQLARSKAHIPHSASPRTPPTTKLQNKRARPRTDQHHRVSTDTRYLRRQTTPSELSLSTHHSPLMPKRWQVDGGTWAVLREAPACTCRRRRALRL